MSDPKLTYYGEMRDTLHIFNRAKLLQDLQQFAGKKLEIIIRKKRSRRSVEQNAYYWGVVIPMVQNGLKDVGYVVDKDGTHEFLKDRFNRIELVNEKTGEILNTTGSTTKLSTTEMMEYFAEIQRWAAEYLNIEIPDPGEQTELSFES